MDIHIREATTEDAQLIADLTRQCWANKVAPDSDGHHEDALRVAEDLQRGGGFVLLFGGKPAGSVRWTPLDTAEGAWEVSRMGVLSTFRGERLSQHLMEALIHRALASDVTELRLAFRTDEMRLVDVYAALGFEIAAELDYTRVNPLAPPSIVMRRWLRYN